jgi:rubrerythrin
MTTTAATYPETTATFVDVRELFCAVCGYGIVIRRDPPDCPMCRARAWRTRPSVEHWN